MICLLLAASVVGPAALDGDVLHVFAGAATSRAFNPPPPPLPPPAFTDKAFSGHLRMQHTRHPHQGEHTAGLQQINEHVQQVRQQLEEIQEHLLSGQTVRVKGELERAKGGLDQVTSAIAELPLQNIQLRESGDSTGSQSQDLTSSVSGTRDSGSLHSAEQEEQALWHEMKRLADEECALARHTLAPQDVSSAVAGCNDPIYEDVMAKYSDSQSLGAIATLHGGGVLITAHNVTKRFSPGIWRTYLHERRALCRLQRFAAPCGRPGTFVSPAHRKHTVQRTHFFPRVLAWDDDRLLFVLSNNGLGMLLGMREGSAIHPCFANAEDGKNHSLTVVRHTPSGPFAMKCYTPFGDSRSGRSVACPAHSPTGGSFAEQYACIEEQLARANTSHWDIHCKNVFVGPDARVTLGDLSLSSVDGVRSHHEGR